MSPEDFDHDGGPPVWAIVVGTALVMAAIWFAGWLTDVPI